MSISDIQTVSSREKAQCVSSAEPYKKRKARPTSSYAEKLKHPLWQKLRLEIFERDGWACQCCFEENKTLQVHHCYYAKGNPWDTPKDCLITLCEECHEERQREEEIAKLSLGRMLANLRDDYRMELVNSLVVASREDYAPVVVNSGALLQLAVQLSARDISHALTTKANNHPGLKFT